MRTSVSLLKIRAIGFGHALVCLGLPVLMLGGLVSAAIGDDAVNLVPSAQQLAQREPCPDGGTLRYAAEPEYAGLPWHLIAKVPAVQRQHAALTANEAPWLQRLAGPAQFNRSYEAAGAAVLLIDNCQPGACDSASVYGVIALPGWDYGLVLTEHGQTRHLGRHNALTDAAIACARTVDRARRAR